MNDLLGANMKALDDVKIDIFILLVEDSLTQARLLKHFLESNQYEVHLSLDGEEAYEWLKSTYVKPDVVLSDIEMPKMNGYDLCKAIRANAELRGIPVILLTSFAEPHNIIRSIDVGANKFLVKPYEKKLLPEVIDELCFNTQRRKEVNQEDGVTLRYAGKDFVITAAKAQLLDLLISSYEDSYYKNTQLQETRNDLEELNEELEEKILERTKDLILKEEQFRTLSENTPNFIVRIDKNFNISYVNDAMEKLFGTSRDRLIGKSIDILDGMVSKFGSCHAIIAEVFKTGNKFRVEIELNIPGKEKVWLDSTSVAEYDKLGEINYVLKVCSDVTEKKKAEEELLKLSQAIEQNQNAIAIVNIDGTIEYVNDAFEVVTGYSKPETVGRKSQEHPSCELPKSEYRNIITQMILGKTYSNEYANQHKSSKEYIENVKYSPIFQADGGVISYIVTKEDITDKKNAEERIHYLANFDSLTGLANKARLEEAIKAAFIWAEQSNKQFAVIVLGLDHFQAINDTLGHHVGDMLLIELGKRFLSLLREEDSVSRFSGDKFIFLMRDVEVADMGNILKKLSKNIALPFDIADMELMVTASIGVSIYPNDGSDTETILKNADVAMYNAKQEGRNCYRFFAQEMQKNSSYDLELSNALYHALKSNQLHVAYQPQVSTHDNRVIGAEALLRWTHPTFGNVPPDKFIHLAEKNGLILEIGEWVMRTAVHQTQRWMEEGLPPMIIAVNISAVQFKQEELQALVEKILEETKLPPHYLEIELTEAVAMKNPQKVYVIMDSLHARGIRMAIDDFGTGYSSLSYLKKFKVYKLKIDQSFIRDIVNNQEDKAIVAAIISMSKSLGLKTIAEGVETKEQFEYLKELGCDEIQGYYFSKPIRAEEFEAFVRARL